VVQETEKERETQTEVVRVFFLSLRLVECFVCVLLLVRRTGTTYQAYLYYSSVVSTVVYRGAITSQLKS